MPETGQEAFGKPGEHPQEMESRSGRNREQIGMELEWMGWKWNGEN
ncbi:MAG: hypothetical protein NC399_02745 [Muribaculum sp.]|nr:hypothetical protein [Muribaculum sp.]